MALMVCGMNIEDSCQLSELFPIRGKHLVALKEDLITMIRKDGAYMSHKDLV